MTELKEIDVLVVGAGIHGAGVAQAAAAGGYSVLVVEKNAEAGCETSSASSKLIHGGLRYLETGQFRLVYECLRERRRLLKNAPELVRLQRFFIPIYREQRRHPIWIGLGLFLYWMLSGFNRQNRFRLLNKQEWFQLGCKTERLRAVFQYYDGQTNDQLLTRAVLRSAQDFGIQTRFGVTLTHAEYSDGRYQVTLDNGEQFFCRALVNAAGPWVNEVAGHVTGAPQQMLSWVQGTHIVLEKPAPMGCFYLESPRDGRAVFVLPWQGKTMVGTTERVLTQPRAHPTEDEVGYLLEVYNSFFINDFAERAGVAAIFAGTRVLPAEERGGNANKRSRETILLQQRQLGSIYLAIYGGKLTSYRSTAEKILAQVKTAIGPAKTPALDTRDLPLS